jgi:hypothetical protein
MKKKDNYQVPYVIKPGSDLKLFADNLNTMCPFFRISNTEGTGIE